ncbi:MAG: hypothetical protein QOD73_745 [Solirubrobacteraceae bacterium]|nr:hypothetical protein [Solirubrobacteraceae bacterium]
MRKATRTRAAIVVAAVPGLLDRTAYPYRLPPAHAPLRVAFVGQRAIFEECALHAPAGGLLPTFVDFREGADARELQAALRAAAPHAVVVFAPEVVPPGAFADLRAPILGVLADHRPPPTAAEYDRILSPDPRAGDAVWRCAPLPVDDRMYAPVGAARRPPRACFLAASTTYRERFVIQAKHEYDVLHYAHGLWGDALREVLGKVDVAINVHVDEHLAFESRVPLHLAAGHLLLSEPLSPTHGLEPEIDFVPILRPDELLTVLGQLRWSPDLHDRVRLRGRAKAEDYRASRMWPRLVGDLLDDVAAFGTARAVS